MAGRARIAAQAAAVAAVAALLALLVWKLAQGGSDIPAAVKEGRAVAAPSFTLPRLDKEGSLSLAELRGRPVIVNFWASWCGPCKDEAPALEEVWQRHRGDGLVLVGIDYDDLRSDARRFARRYGMTYPIVYDRDKEAVRAYGLTGLPETFFIDRRGRVVGQIIGNVNSDRTRERFDALVRRVLA